MPIGGAATPRTAIDLFSGAGGMTQGLKDAGFAVLAAVELDPLAASTYRANHSEVHLFERDIREVTGEQLLGVAAGRGIDLLAGCPPCQGFSSVATLNGHRERPDKRNDLVLEYARLVIETRPAALMMENVPGLLHDARMRLLLEELEGLGYRAKGGVRTLNAANYGVPQRRRRLVMLAGRGIHVTFPEPAAEHATVRDAIGDLPVPGVSGDPLHDLPENRTARIRELIAGVPKDGGSRSDLDESFRLPCHTDFDGFRDVYGRMAWDRPAPTITGGCDSPSKGRFLHPGQDRTITMREAALLQTFPPGYSFSLDRGKSGVAQMIGNALPPAFVAAHGGAVLRALAPSSDP